MLWLLPVALLVASASAPQNPATGSVPPIARPSYEPDRGPTIAIDEAHKNTHTLGGQFQALGRLLRRDGYRVRSLAENISRHSLEGIDILVIAQPGGWEGPDASLSASEVTSLVEWVKRGGSLLLILDHMPAPAGGERVAKALGVERWQNGYAAIETPEAQVFNIRFERPGQRTDPAVVPLFGNSVAWQGPGAYVREHVITSGRDADERVDAVVSFGGSAFQSPAGAEPLLVLPVGAVSLTPAAATGPPQFSSSTPRVAVAGWHQAAVMTLDRGRVGLFADAGMFSAQWPVHPSASRNYQLVLNLMRWLSGAGARARPFDL